MSNLPNKLKDVEIRLVSRQVKLQQYHSRRLAARAFRRAVRWVDSQRRNYTGGTPPRPPSHIQLKMNLGKAAVR